VTTTGNQDYLSGHQFESDGKVTLNGTYTSTSGSFSVRGFDGATTAALAGPVVVTTNSGVSFDGSVDGPFALTTNNTAPNSYTLFGIGPDLGDMDVASLTTGANGSTDVYALDVTTSGAQIYGNPVYFDISTTLTSTGAGNITFASTVDAGIPSEP
jgi:hypothetical protein